MIRVLNLRRVLNLKRVLNLRRVLSLRRVLNPRRVLNLFCRQLSKPSPNEPRDVSTPALC